MSELFQPLRVGDVEVQHRIALAPLTRFRNRDYEPNTELLREYYSQRSSRPGTLIITEATFISSNAGGYTRAPGIFTDEHVARWKPVFEAIHANSSSVFVQLWALGRQAPPAVNKELGIKYVSASSVYMDEATRLESEQSGNPLHALTVPEIDQYVRDYVHAARNSLAAGADGVEIHSANGYLLNQFIDPICNTRDDEYGGSIENRARFTLRVVDALVEAVGASKVGIRFSPFGVFGTMSGDSNPLILAQYAYLFGELEKRAQHGHRLAYIHLVEPRAADLTTCPKASNDFIYSIWNGVVIKAGEFGDKLDEAKKQARNGNTIIAIGRHFISNPDIVDRIENNWELNDFDRDTFYTEGAVGYTDYPFHSQ